MRHGWTSNHRSSAEQISDLGVKKSNVKLQQPGTVLLSFKLSIGRVAIAAVPLFVERGNRIGLSGQLA